MRKKDVKDNKLLVEFIIKGKGICLSDKNSLKVLRNETGVYRIVNIKNGKSYIGKSVTCLRVRMANHITKMLKGNHDSRLIQEDFDKHSLDDYYVYFLSRNTKAELGYIKLYKPEFNIQGMKGRNKRDGHIKRSKEYLSNLLNSLPKNRAVVLTEKHANCLGGFAISRLKEDTEIEGYVKGYFRVTSKLTHRFIAPNTLKLYEIQRHILTTMNKKKLLEFNITKGKLIWHG